MKAFKIGLTIVLFFTLLTKINFAQSFNLSHFNYLIGYWECVNNNGLYMHWKNVNGTYVGTSVIKTFNTNGDVFETITISRINNEVYLKKYIIHTSKELNFKFFSYQKNNVKFIGVNSKTTSELIIRKKNNREMEFEIKLNDKKQTFFYRKTKSRSVRFD